MTTVFEPAYAKVNLTLDVLGKREDGYHDLQSVMQTISLRDDIESFFVIRRMFPQMSGIWLGRQPRYIATR